VYESTVVSVSHFTAHGYTAARGERGLRDLITGLTYRPERLRIDDLLRFAGESDPGDSAVVFAPSDSESEERGTDVVAFDPQMDRLDAEAVHRSSDAHHRKAEAGRRSRGCPSS
jgi:hypothetical protein